MLKFLTTSLLLGAVFLGLNWEMRPWAARACAKPVAYAIGTLDRRFDISQSEFLSALAEAEAIWEQPLRGEGLSIGIELFAYEPEDGALTVNLVYDYRQEATAELSELESEVKEDEAAYRALEREYARLKAEHASLEESYEARLEAFNRQSAVYEQSVEDWNNGSRTSREDFEALEAERLSLEAEVRVLEAQEAALNRKVREVNNMVERLNRLARTLNLNAEEYNSIGASRGETFAGGIYSSDARGQRIDIYEFSSREKLVRILAHELGHALGLEHIDDPEAIMYHLNKGEAGAATESDLLALKALCNAN